MEPFNNHGRWLQLVEYVQGNPDLFGLIRDIWKFYADVSEIDLTGKVEGLFSAGSRDILRLGLGDSLKINAGFGDFIAAVKIGGFPGKENRNHFSYDNESFFDSHSSFNYHYKETRLFEKYGKEGEVLVPKVTGVVTGFGLIGTLTEDISEGGKYDPEFDEMGNRSIKRKFQGRVEEVYVDLKYDHHGSLKDCADYFQCRLRVDEE